jgi:hypothetical protein
VRLVNPKTIFLRPGYRLAAVAGDSPLPLTLGAEPFLASGEGARQYDLTVEEGRMAVITLESRGSRLSVHDRDRSTEELPVTTSADGQIQSVFLGERFEGSSQVLRPLSTRLRLRVAITPDQRAGMSSSSRYKAPFWSLTVRRSQQREDYLLGISSELVEGWGELRGTKAGKIESGSKMKIYSLMREGRGAQQFAARLRTTDTGNTLNIAICNRFGYALDIGSDSVRWSWSPDTESLFLVIFPTPSTTLSPNGSKFEVSVSEVFAANQQAK